MRQPTLRILLLEDSPADAELVTLELRHAGLDAVTQRADTEDAFVRAVRDFAPDVVLSDHSLAQFNSTAALRLLPTIRTAQPPPARSVAARRPREFHPRDRPAAQVERQNHRDPPGGGDEAARHPRDRRTGALRRPRPPHFHGNLRRPRMTYAPPRRIPSYAGRPRDGRHVVFARPQPS